VVDEGSNSLIYIDRHLVHEVMSPQAFEGLRTAKRNVRRPDCTLVTVDHNVPTSDRSGYTSAATYRYLLSSRAKLSCQLSNMMRSCVVRCQQLSADASTLVSNSNLKSLFVTLFNHILPNSPSLPQIRKEKKDDQLQKRRQLATPNSAVEEAASKALKPLTGGLVVPLQHTLHTTLYL
jgi:hypothetical protein